MMKRNILSEQIKALPCGDCRDLVKMVVRLQGRAFAGRIDRRHDKLLAECKALVERICPKEGAKT